MDKCSKHIRHEDCVNCSTYDKENELCDESFCTTCGGDANSFTVYCNKCIDDKVEHTLYSLGDNIEVYLYGNKATSEGVLVYLRAAFAFLAKEI